MQYQNINLGLKGQNLIHFIIKTLNLSTLFT